MRKDIQQAFNRLSEADLRELAKPLCTRAYTITDPESLDNTIEQPTFTLQNLLDAYEAGIGDVSGYEKAKYFKEKFGLII